MKYFHTLLLALAFLLASCSKEDNPTTPSTDNTPVSLDGAYILTDAKLVFKEFQNNFGMKEEEGIFKEYLENGTYYNSIGKGNNSLLITGNYLAEYRRGTLASYSTFRFEKDTIWDIFKDANTGATKERFYATFKNGEIKLNNTYILYGVTSSFDIRWSRSLNLQGAKDLLAELKSIGGSALVANIAYENVTFKKK
jgi:hypothetical protein